MKTREIPFALMLILASAGVTTTSCSRAKHAAPPEKDTAEVTAATLPAPAVEASHGIQRSYDEEALGHLDASLAALDEVPASPTASYVVALRRGWLLYRLGRSAESIADYQRAVAAAPASIEAKVGLLAPQAALRRWLDVEATARDVLRKDPGSYQATIRLAFALYSQAKFADAAATYRALLVGYPSDVDAQDGLGWSLLKMGAKADAAATFARVLEIAPKNELAIEGARASK